MIRLLAFLTVFVIGFSNVSANFFTNFFNGGTTDQGVPSPVDTATYYRYIPDQYGNTLLIGETKDGYAIIVSLKGNKLNKDFNETGFVVSAAGDTNAAVYNAIKTDFQGNIIVAGSTKENYAIVARYNEHGQLDTSFNDVGFVINTMASAYYEILSWSGPITAVGFTHDDRPVGVHYTVSGRLDTSFHETGSAIGSETMKNDRLSYEETKTWNAANIIYSGDSIFFKYISGKTVSLFEWSYEVYLQYHATPPSYQRPRSSFRDWARANHFFI